MQDILAALEIDAALQAKGPELVNGLLQQRKLAMVFKLWDPQARGSVNRAAIAAVLEFFYRQAWAAALSGLSCTCFDSMHGFLIALAVTGTVPEVCGTSSCSPL